MIDTEDFNFGMQCAMVGPDGLKIAFVLRF